MKQKIVIVENSVDVTGALQSITFKATDLKKSFDFVFIVPPSPNVEAFLKNKGFKVYTIKFLEISKRIHSIIFYLPVLLRNAYRISKILKKEHSSIVHTNDLYNLAPLLSKLFTSVKVLTHIRRMPESFPFGIYKIWVGIHLRFSDLIIPVSIANSRIFGKSEKVKVVYNPLPLEQKYEQYNVSTKGGSPIKLLYLANYIVGKGQDHAIKVAQLLRASYPAFSFNISFAGGDMGLEKNKEFKRSLKLQSLELNLPNYISFDGKVNDVEQYMKKYDIILNFSDSESLSRLSMESLYYGIPLIATDVGGTDELLVDGVSGFLVRPGDIRQMAEKIVELSSNFELRLKFSRNSTKYVVEKFSKENTSFQLGTIYLTLLRQ